MWGELGSKSLSLSPECRFISDPEQESPHPAQPSDSRIPDHQTLMRITSIHYFLLLSFGVIFYMKHGIADITDQSVTKGRKHACGRTWSSLSSEDRFITFESKLCPVALRPGTIYPFCDSVSLWEKNNNINNCKAQEISEEWGSYHN